MGCEANSEFNVATMDDRDTDIYYITEESSFCIRLLCKNARPWNTTLHEGNDKDGKLMATYTRPFRCPMGNCKCCCYQEVMTDVGGTQVGTTVESMWFCVPGFDVKDSTGETKYNMHMPTCVGGMCINCCAEGLCNCRIPFYIYPVGSDDEVGKIVKIWSGMKSELLTDADKIELEFPPDADTNMKATLLGTTLMINQLFFESQKGQ